MPINNPSAVEDPSTSGNYTGDSSANRGIAHGLGAAPRLVVIMKTDATYIYRIQELIAFIYYLGAAANGELAVTAVDTTNFYVGNATNYGQSANNTGDGYRWVAFR